MIATDVRTVKAFSVRQIEDTFGMPDGEVSRSWEAFDDDTDTIIRGCYSTSCDETLRLARLLLGDVPFTGLLFCVGRGERY